MGLSSAESAMLRELRTNATRDRRDDKKFDAYYNAEQIIPTIGLGVPPELRVFEFALAWPQLVVDAINDRLKVKMIIRPDTELADAEMMRDWAASNLDSQSMLAHLDALIYRRSYVSVGTNPDPNGRPLIRVESPEHMTSIVDQQSRRLTAALRTYVDDVGRQAATLYLPDETISLRTNMFGRLVEESRDRHGLGRVPIVLFLNRPRAGKFDGRSEIAPLIGPTDMVGRQLMNLQVTAESHSVPDKWAVGVSKGDFVDEDGEPLAVWESYFTAMKATANPQAKFGNFDAADLANFTKVITMLSEQMSAITGLPPDYFGISTANPPAEGAIRAAENRLITRCEKQQMMFGDCWGWVLGIAERLRTGVWPEGDLIRVEWHDAGTPTFAQKVDGLSKMTGGKEILSREGAWDELGWSEARKDRERKYLEQEAAEGLGAFLTRPLNENRGTDDPAGGN